MLTHVLDLLCCPLCRADLAADAGSLLCPGGHRFDVARQGYVNLLPGPAPAAADTAAMVAARSEVVAAGLLTPLSDALATTIAAFGPEPDDAPATGAKPGQRHGPAPGAAQGAAPTILEVGSGPAQHLAAVLAVTGGRGLAVDLSKHAARRAAWAHPRIGAVVADVWAGLPVHTGASDVVLVVFAPRPVRELLRVLRPGGRLVVVTPRPEHLAELAAATPLLRIDADKPAQLDAAVAEVAVDTEVVAHQPVAWEQPLTPTLARALVAMGPSAHHAEVAADTDWPTTVRLAVTVSVYRRRST